MFQNIKDYIPGIHKDGYLIILFFIAITFILFAFSETLGYLGILATIWCVFFFRDPDKVVPLGDELVVSPADGIVQSITQALPPKELMMEEQNMTRVSIFLSVFDVHVNRIPVSGKVNAMYYNPGKFFNASLDKASEDNERQSILIETDYNNKSIAVVQIAGLIARRIVCNLHPEQNVTSGKRFGIIKFGSRVDLYLPTEVKVNVLVGQRVIGGETIISDLSDNNNEKKPLIGEVR